VPSASQFKNTHFAGFAAPTSNTTYTPNQFFDVCLPHCSRGTVRLVAYMIRKTLGWCDAHGNPQQEVIQFSYSELERYAGVIARVQEWSGHRTLQSTLSGLPQRRLSSRLEGIKYSYEAGHLARN
jgi:hypothetical protein